MMVARDDTVSAGVDPIRILTIPATDDQAPWSEHLRALEDAGTYRVTSSLSVEEASFVLATDSVDLVIISERSVELENPAKEAIFEWILADAACMIISDGNETPCATLLERGVQEILAGGCLTTDILRQSIKRSVHRHRHTRQLLRRAEASEQREENKNAFLSEMSHEIRTPLTAILGYSDMLGREHDSLDSDHREDLLERMQVNTTRLISTVHQILERAQDEDESTKLKRRRCEYRTCLSRLAEGFEARAKEFGASFQFQIAQSCPPKINTNPIAMTEILRSIIGTAIQHVRPIALDLHVDLADVPARDALSIRIRSSTERNAATAQQTHNALSADDPNADAAAGVDDLKESLAHESRLAARLDGALMIDVDSSGATFELQLPIARAKKIATESPATPVDAPPTPAKPDATMSDTHRVDDAMPLNGRRILLAEDGVDNQNLFSMILERAGAEVIVKPDGRQAMETVLQESKSGRPFDVILMDMQMPVLDGYTATLLLRGSGFIGPILALTACALSHDRQKCLNAGCNDYMSKPIERDDFIDMVARYCRNHDRNRRVAAQVAEEYAS